ncbi:hypothetical protein [Oceanirhabdus seepicola]|uniref:Uncharacterized protein n=1 Tax=Oceanirhabdus seepicola TaxID=2828781 RepID=A0A9J6P662_9CLOT|nr:hypothetical protein [Oceanirhabdus seepicola]MCM1991748.1 hypothetical protein [Oceanirhabdus seepicola]
MDKKVIIEVFGVKETVPQSSGCGCGPKQTMGEMYDEFEALIQKSDISSEVEVKFIDVEKDDIDTYDYIKVALESGYSLPLTAVNQKVRFQGKVPYMQIYRLIKRSL